MLLQCHIQTIIGHQCKVCNFACPATGHPMLSEGTLVHWLSLARTEFPFFLSLFSHYHPSMTLFSAGLHYNDNEDGTAPVFGTGSKQMKQKAPYTEIPHQHPESLILAATEHRVIVDACSSMDALRRIDQPSKRQSTTTQALDSKNGITNRCRYR